MLKPLIVAACLALAACGPSCEERGGHTEFSHFQPMFMMAGKVPMTHLVPIYKCVGAADDTHNQHGEAADL